MEVRIFCDRVCIFMKWRRYFYETEEVFLLNRGGFFVQWRNQPVGWAEWAPGCWASSSGEFLVVISGICRDFRDLMPKISEISKNTNYR